MFGTSGEECPFTLSRVHRARNQLCSQLFRPLLTVAGEFNGCSGLSIVAWSRATDVSRIVESKKAPPFVVLIGVYMPSILAETSFLIDPDNVHEPGQPACRSALQIRCTRASRSE
jgi:hypothetical protein